MLGNISVYFHTMTLGVCKDYPHIAVVSQQYIIQLLGHDKMDPVNRASMLRLRSCAGAVLEYHNYEKHC